MNRSRRAAAGPLLAVLLVLAAVLAGCSGDAPRTIVVDSAVGPVATDTEPTAPPAPRNGREGHIAGYVVDERFNVLPGIHVTLPAFSLVDKTDRNGEFSFVDLPPGSYLMQIAEKGHQTIRTMVDVEADRFTRLQVILRSIPPPTPYHETWEFTHVEPVTTSGIDIVRFSNSWSVNASAGLHTIVLEAYMDDYAGAAGGHNGFNYAIGYAYDTFTSGRATNPLRVVFQVNGTDIRSSHYEVDVTPYGDPVPETDKEYEVFVTMFYHAPPPEGWTIADA